MKHLSNEQLVALAEDPGEPRPAHLETCGQCSRELETWSSLLTTMRRDRSPEPAAAVLEQAHALFQGRSRARRAAERLNHWIASLVMDSGTLAPAMAGVRGAAAEARQLLFSTEQADVDLSHPLNRVPAPLRGQVLPRGDAAADVGAWRPVTLIAVDGERTPEITSADSLGVFRFLAVWPGSYELHIEMDAGEVVVPFELSAPGAESA